MISLYQSRTQKPCFSTHPMFDENPSTCTYAQYTSNTVAALAVPHQTWCRLWLTLSSSHLLPFTVSFLHLVVAPENQPADTHFSAAVMTNRPSPVTCSRTCLHFFSAFSLICFAFFRVPSSSLSFSRRSALTSSDRRICAKWNRQHKLCCHHPGSLCSQSGSSGSTEDNQRDFVSG